MKKLNFFLLGAMIFALTFSSCKKNDDESQPEMSSIENNSGNSDNPSNTEVTPDKFTITVKAVKTGLGETGIDENFQATDKLVVTWGTKGSVELGLISGAGTMTATFSGEVAENVNDQTLTAHLGSPITSTSTVGFTSLADAVKSNCYFVSDKSFAYSENIDPITLVNQNSYLHIKLADSQTKFDLEIDGNRFTFNTFTSGHEIWVVVPAGKNVKGNLISVGGKCFDAAIVNTIDRTDVVDLGSSKGVLWTLKNLGAETPNDYGYFYAWGGTRGYNSGSDDPYTGDENPLPSSNDAATIVLGAEYRMPTKDELQELENISQYPKEGDICSYEIDGVTFTTPYGSVYLPAAGGCYGGERNAAREYGFYWSSSLFYDESELQAYDFGFCIKAENDKYARVGNTSRSHGRSVRAVRYIN